MVDSPSPPDSGINTASLAAGNPLASEGRRPEAASHGFLKVALLRPRQSPRRVAC
jgi:hypothetical protein